jgi:enoyl-CoA hydratase
MNMSLVSYTPQDGVACVVMDDGKVNVVSSAMQAELHAALDRAEADNAVVLLSGRDKAFSAGFDLATLQAGGPPAEAMLRGGFELAERMLSFPQPLVIACRGHAMAMGAFLLLCGDYRIGADGPTKFAANEVSIGLTMPLAAVEILRQRLTPAAFTRATLLSETFTPANAVEAGFLDQVVAPDELDTTATALARSLTSLDKAAHAASKLRARAATLAAMRAGIDAEFPAP